MSTFSLPGRIIVCEVRPVPNSATGGGRPEFPTLICRTNLSLRAPKDAALYFREMRCRVSPQDSQYAAVSLPAVIDVRLDAAQELQSQSLYIEIPLDGNRVALFERLRNGGDFQLRLDCLLFVEELVVVGQHKVGYLQNHYSLRHHHVIGGQFSIQIPRSEWCERVLPNLGFGSIHLIELPGVPITKCEHLKASYEALRKAQQLERDGHYHEAVAKCRTALEPLFELVDRKLENGETRKVPALKRSWAMRIGTATYDWLNSCLLSLKEEGNKASHHSSKTFDQIEAQMILVVTTGVVAYAIKTQPDLG